MKKEAICAHPLWGGDGGEASIYLWQKNKQTILHPAREN